MTANPANDFAPKDRARELLRQFGYNALSFQILQPQFQLWFDGNRACVAYLDTGKAWIAAGPPLAARAQVADVAQRFIRAAATAGRRAALFGVEAAVALGPQLQATVVGRQIVVDPTRWSATAPRRLNEQLRRARNKALSIECYTAADLVNPSGSARSDINGLIERWQRGKAMPEMGFLGQIRPLLVEEDRRYYVARLRGECVGFAALDPVYCRGGWVLQNLVRAPRAPNGTSESLIDRAIRDSAVLGSTYFSLGMTPLAGEVGTYLTIAKRCGRPLYNFSGLERFRSKFSADDGVPLYLAYPEAQSPFFAVHDTLVAFARGSLVGFGAKVLLHRWLPQVLERQISQTPPFAQTAEVR